MAATLFRYLSYLGLVLGIGLSFWVLRWGALCFLFSIACSHLAVTAKTDTHFNQIHETLFIVLSILGQLKKKVEEGDANPKAEDVSRARPAQKLREYRDI